jgi:K+-sensing histidine kinase KdpD
LTDPNRHPSTQPTAAEHLRAVDEMKTTFLHAVSHDLRTPLTTVLGIALTLERRAAGLPARDLADLLHACPVTPGSWMACLLTCSTWTGSPEAP